MTFHWVRPALSQGHAVLADGMRCLALRLCLGLGVVILGLGAAAPVQAQTATPDLIQVNIPDAEPAAPTRSAEVRGLLPHANDHHYFGLEATHPGSAFAVTLTVEPAAALAQGDGVNFLVLTEEGLNLFLAGANPQAVKVAMGSPLLFDQAGNRLTALVPGSTESGYTVIVYNQGTLPVAYTLQVQGAILHDDAGQTYASYGLVEPSTGGSTSVQRLLTRTSPVTAVDTAALMASSLVVQRLGATSATGSEVAAPEVAALDETSALVALDAPDKLPPVAVPVRARRVSGTLGTGHDRHYLNLIADERMDEITLRLTTVQATAPAGADQVGPVNFWVMTQDGVRHLIQGVQPGEVSLAVGAMGQDGVVEAHFRAAPQVIYTVVVFNERGEPVDYALQVTGGMVLDQYGQTREAHAAAMEMLALAN